MSRVRKDRRRKSIDKQTELVITNNIFGEFDWETKNGDVSIILNDRGDYDFAEFGELRKMKPYLEKLKVLITEVNDDEVSIMDVADGFRIGDVYSDFFKYIEGLSVDEVTPDDVIDVEDVEDFIIDSDADEFKEALDSNLRLMLIEYGVNLYRQHKLNDYEKLEAIKQSRNLSPVEAEEFWSDVMASEI